MSTRRRELLFACAAAPVSAARAAPRRLRIPHLPAAGGIAASYPALLLSQALDAAGQPATLDAHAERIPQGRALQELGHQGGGLDLMWTMTSIEREQLALPVRVPLYKGLYNWRLLLATPEVAARMRGVRTLQELRSYRLLQGRDWPDTGILQANGLNVVTSGRYEAMFEQLRLGRADAFPRSVQEIWPELERHGQGLSVVPGLGLHYPAAVYYFVRPGEPELAAAIELGLHRLRASGAFERLFQKFHGAGLARARLGSRRIVELSNPMLPPRTPLDRPELWFHPQA